MKSDMQSDRPPTLAESLGADQIGHEARAQAGDHIELKIWLRLLACSTQIEKQIRRKLRERFATTLPRFDCLAQLERHPQGLQMKRLSSYLMVSGGNLTALADQLVEEGLVRREVAPDDRRAFLAVLTDKGRREFVAMAAEHETWLADMFDGLAKADKDALFEQLGRLRLNLARQTNEASAALPPGTPTSKRRPGVNLSRRLSPIR